MARLEQYRQEMTYRIYVTDFMAGFGGENSPRYADYLTPPKKPEKVEFTSVEEDVDRIWKNMGR